MRILQGKLKNKEFGSKKGLETRPTTSMVKEAIFNKLSEEVGECEFLDLFAGTGAIAFEAISRGAKRAVLIEQDALALKIIIDNIKKLGISNQCRAYKNSAEKAIDVLKNKADQFDVIFLDPPYSGNFSLKTIEKLAETNLLRTTGILVCEHHKTEDLPDTIGKFEKNSEKNYGNKRVSFFHIQGE